MSIYGHDLSKETYEHLGEKERELTKTEKRANWWHYHKWHTLIAVVGIFCAADILAGALGIGEVKPDYQIAYVGTHTLPEDTIKSLEALFAEIGEDYNNDGKVVTVVHQYSTLSAEDMDSDAAYYKYASDVSLLGDIDNNDSFFFLLDNPESFAKGYASLAYLDGSLPGDFARDYENLYIAWTDSPLLASRDMGSYTDTYLGNEVSGSNNEILDSLYFARRGFWTEKTCKNLEGCEALWNKIIGKE